MAPKKLSPNKLTDAQLEAQPFGLEAGSCARDAPTQTGRDHRDHHEGNRLAAPLGPRLLDGGGAHQARPDARLREDRGRARLPHRGERCLTEAQRQIGSQGGVTGMPRPLFDRDAIEAEIDRLRSIDLDALRTLWRVTFRPPRRRPSPKISWRGFFAGISRSRPSAGLIRRPQSISTASHGATSGERIAPGPSSPAPCSCANTRASGTPSRSFQMDMCGARRPTQASPPSRGTSPAQPGAVPASLGCARVAIV